MNYREEQLKQAQQRVAKEEQKASLIRQQIQAIDDGVDKAYDDYHQKLADHGFDWIYSQHFSHYLVQLEQAKAQKQEALEAQNQILNQAKRELQAAMVRKKSLMCLKDKQWEQFQQSVRKEEEKFLEEIALRQESLVRLSG